MIHKSPFAPIPVKRQSVSEAVFAGIALDRPVLIDGISGQGLTGRAFLDAVFAFSGGLAVRGMGRGDVVALMAGNSPTYAVIFHGTLWAGATLTTANPGYTAKELHHQLIDSGARLLCIPAALRDLAAEAVTGTKVTETLIIDDAGLAAFAGPPVTAQVPVDLDDDICVLPYSSGTTGLPKGVMLTHMNLVTNLAQCRDTFRLTPHSTTLAILPFFHIYGMVVLMNTFLAESGTLVTLPRFDLEASLRLIAGHRMEFLMVVPPLVLALAKHPMVDQFDLSSLRAILSAAAPLGSELATVCASRLGCEVMQGYGMTEMSPLSHCNRRGASRMGSVGQTVALTESLIVDSETQDPVGVDQPGELWVRGPQVMKGYLNNQQATTATITTDGWLRTGDLARIDADGHLWILDRVKELIKVKGFQVAPAELEAILFGLPDLADCAVIGQPDDEAGERPVAFVVRKAGSDITEAAIMAHLAPQVATYKHLVRVYFTDSIPKTASGKILRRQLRLKLQQG